MRQSAGTELAERGGGGGEREGTYLSDCGSDAVVLATDGGRARLGRDQPDVVARTKLAKAQE